MYMRLIMLISNNFNIVSDDVDGDEPVWDVCGDDDDMMSSSCEHNDDISRTCCVNILLNTASLVDLPRWDKLTTWIGHETENEKETGQIGTSRGNGGNMERVHASDVGGDDDVDDDVDVVDDDIACAGVCCSDVLFVNLLLLIIFDNWFTFEIFWCLLYNGGNVGIEDDVDVGVVVVVVHVIVVVVFWGIVVIVVVIVWFVVVVAQVVVVDDVLFVVAFWCMYHRWMMLMYVM
jgi:hypothetical protein